MSSHLLLRAIRRVLKEVEIRLERRRGNVRRQPAVSNGMELEIASLLNRLQLPPDAAAYLEQHRHRLVQTLRLVPPGNGRAPALELGSYLQMAAVLARVLNYAAVEGAYYSAQAGYERKSIAISGEPDFECDVSLFDAERHRFPYGDASFDLVMCCELIEHLVLDPMHLLFECHRILNRGGHLLITVPNIASLHSVAAVLHGWRPPQVFSRYPKAGNFDTPHVHEYTPREIALAVEAAGFEVESLSTERQFDSEDHSWVENLLQREGFDTSLRGEQIYCLARKSGASPRDRYPAFLYAS